MKSVKALFLAIALAATYSISGQVAITTDGSSADGSAMLEVKSTTKGFLPPRMTTAQIMAIANPANGLIVFNTTDDKIYTYVATAEIWKEISFGTGTISQFTCGSTFTDSRDSKVYTTVQIGDQCWMAENLNVGTRINGSVDQTDNSTLEKHCYSDSEANCDEYGGLYQWAELMDYATTPGEQGICPDGWHVPMASELEVLTDYVSSQSEYQCNSNPNYNAKSLASTSGWMSSTNTCAVGNNQAANNSTGYAGKPGGGLTSGWYDLSKNCYLWSSTGSINDAQLISLSYLWGDVYSTNNPNTWSYSVRCLKNDAPTLSEYRVFIAVNGDGSCSGDGQYEPGEEVNLSAMAHEGTFLNWTDVEGNEYYDENYSFTMPSHDVFLTATFSER